MSNDQVITADVTPVIIDSSDDEVIEEEIIEEEESSYEEELADSDDDDGRPVDPEGERGASVQSFAADELFDPDSESPPDTPPKDPPPGHITSGNASIDTNSTDDWGQKWGQSDAWNRSSSRRISSGGAIAPVSEDYEYGDSAAAATAGGSSSTSTPKVRKIVFPSSYMLFCLAVLIVLIVGGIVTGVSIYARDNDPLDPLDRPSDGGEPSEPAGPTPSLPGVPTSEPSAAPSVQFTTLLDLFASVAGDDVYQTGTSANLAANWMILQDPQLVENGGTVPVAYTDQRTEAGWLQRYLLVLLYYATTNNRESEWLSCNPLRAFGGNSDITGCSFTNPTEVAGEGRIIYDIVPSNRWLSLADECDWAGISCITVFDEQAETTRLAVTSINLAGQRLEGSIVTALVELPVLRILDLSHNGLSGVLDDRFKKLEVLHFQYNTMTGPIPNTFFNDDSVMQRLNVGANQMNGTIPGEVGLASKMTGLYVFENDFEGTIPVLGNMPLRQFHGQRNRFAGILPFDLFIGVWAETISEWWVFENEMTGQLSQNLGLFPNLQDFRVGNNRFVGNIPSSIYTLGQLFRLELNDNLLTGTIDTMIGNLTSLETIDLTGNGFTGVVPTEIADIDVLKSVKLQFNALAGDIPTGLCFLTSMELLEADCLPEANPPNPCACCTRCCDRVLEVCEGFDV